VDEVEFQCHAELHFNTVCCYK